MFREIFKGFEPFADLIKAANLVIGATTLIYKVYVKFKPAVRQAWCALQAARGNPNARGCPPGAPGESGPPGIL